ncbi:UNVERIFIED_ORG: hypothetical protein ABIC54_002970 [Burkholderia sp. 1263]|jgi:hypothetical protein|uniref:Uncharacterized protein n=1 Tax=Paraburkholderia terricola TaxID=169427 RepID=A0ABU1LMM6_9BURK|nr:hypothetical protein [Paraburkholderia terricola]MDR6444598.1 hypothetical protein [Paraburkholderia terricola]MDR6479798.1 hypothetical protein [Paraburkholderia terricola]
MPGGVVAARLRPGWGMPVPYCAWLRFAQVDDNVNVDSIVQSNFLPGHGMPR